MQLVADRSAVSESAAHRQWFADVFAWRLTMLGAAALGFLVTFIALDHEIHKLENVMLPLLVILPAYLLLMSLNMWWAAKATARLGSTLPLITQAGARRVRGLWVLKVCLGLASGVIIALWYVHSVS